MKKNLQKLTTIIVFALVIIMMPAKDVSAKNNENSPYGYTFEDAATGRTVYKYYKNNLENRVFYGTANKVCKKNGTIITSLSAGTGSRYNGFGLTGIFYIITSKGELLSVDRNNKVTTLLPSGALSLMYTADELADVVATSSGNKYLATLTNAPLKDAPSNEQEPTPVTPVKKAPNRVEAYQNSASEMVYEAYKSNKVILKIITSKNGKSVLNSTKGVRLSDFTKGAKFMGIDPSYNVYMYETNGSGTLYRFKPSNWYSAEKIVLSSAFKSFETKNGFIEKVVTNKESYTIKQLTTSGKWKAKTTYAVNKGNSYVTLYVKGSTKSHTLSINKGVLYLNGKAIDIGVSKKFGFISAKKFAYIKGGKVRIAPIAKPMNSKIYCTTKATDFKKTGKGLITKAVLTNGKTKKLS